MYTRTIESHPTIITLCTPRKLSLNSIDGVKIKSKRRITAHVIETAGLVIAKSCVFKCS